MNDNDVALSTQSLNLSAFDIGIVFSYFAVMMAIGLCLHRRGDRFSLEEFLLAGRKLSPPLFIGTVVSSWYGGLLGIGEIGYRDGLSGWLIQGWFWYASYFVFTFFVIPKLYESPMWTLPEQMGHYHGSLARSFASVLNIVDMVPITYVLSLGLLFQWISGFPLWVSIVVSTGVTVLYSIVGGLRAVVYTDVLQFGFMCLSVGILMIASVMHLGDMNYLTASLPPSHVSITGDLSAQELLTWAIIAFSTLVDPGFYHRCYATDRKTAQRGMLCAIAIWMMFDVCTIFTALYARAALPGIDPRMSFPLLATTILPEGLKGVYFVGVISCIMSTIDSSCFVGGMTFSHDLWSKFRRNKPHKEVFATQIGIVATGMVAGVFALVYDGSIKTLWKMLGSLSSSALLVPMLFGFFGWAPKQAGFLSSVTGASVTLLWAIAQKTTLPFEFIRTTEPLIPGISVALFVYLAIGLRRR